MVGVGAIIIEGGRVLLVKRGKAPLAGQWSIPGGALELGETIREGVAREALEETGLQVEPADLLGVFDRVVRDDDGRTLYHYVLIDFLCRRISGEALAAGDAAGVGWFLPAELPSLSLAKDTAEVIQLAFDKAVNS